MPQFNRKSTLNEDQQIIKALTKKLTHYPKLELIVKPNTPFPFRTHIWDKW